MLLCRELRNLTTRNGSDIATADYDISYLDGNGNYVNGHRTGETFFITRPSSTNPTTCTASNRCTSRQVFDARERLLRHETGTGQVTTYALDEPAMLLNDTTIRAGNVTTEVDNGGGTSTTTNRYYTSNQLTKTTTTAGGSSQSAWYWYDTLSNLSCISNTATRPWCGPAASGTLLDGLLVDYDYDYLERLRSIRYYAASGRTDHTTYRYDVLDRTVSQREDHGTGSTGTTHDRTTRFTYLGMTTAVTEETSEPLNGGAITRTKNYDYDATGTRTSMTDTPTGGTPTFYSYGYDPHGSVNQLLTATGTIKASYGYDAYGNQDNAPTAANDLSIGDITPQAPLNPYRYTGKRIDPGTAATSSAQPEIGAAGYDMGARRYSPQTTRFLQDDIYSSALSDLALSTDPLTANRYSLAAGNPTSYIETDGHMLKDEGATASGSSSGSSNDSSSADGPEDSAPTQSTDLTVSGESVTRTATATSTAQSNVSEQPRPRLTDCEFGQTAFAGNCMGSRLSEVGSIIKTKVQIGLRNWKIAQQRAFSRLLQSVRPSKAQLNKVEQMASETPL